jgi:hypothetical protein
MTDDTLEAISRRRFFARLGSGLAGMALVDLLAADGAAATSLSGQPAGFLHDLEPGPGHFPARAKSVIQLFMHGGPSQVDLLDPKPALARYDGKNFPGVIDVQQPEQAGGVLKSPFKFSSHGQSGIQLSELLPHLARCVDELCVVHSMFTEHINHEPALWMIHTGRTVPGRPSMASWVVYGLGSENRNLPAYLVLDDPKGLPIDGIRNWSSGWLPPLYQGTRFRSEGPPVWNLQPVRPIPRPFETARRQFLATLDEAHRAAHPGEPELDARIASYQLAARMQVSATDALDLRQETKATHRMYGLDNPTTASYGRRCLMARRLVERGVRYVQLFIDQQIWDNHSELENGLRGACARTDQPVSALLQDLRQRGLLDQTLVIWGGEFGRLPISQSKNGRDHNRQGFSLWLAGGGVKKGLAYGATDEFGYAAAQNRVSVPDFHATVLHLLGLDHKRLVFRRNGLDERLTSTYEPRVVKELLA